jgi:hypothetical protein
MKFLGYLLGGAWRRARLRLPQSCAIVGYDSSELGYFGLDSCPRLNPTCETGLQYDRRSTFASYKHIETMATCVDHNCLAAHGLVSLGLSLT